MMGLILVIAITAIIFIAMIVITAKSKQNKASAKMTTLAAVFASTGGLFIYGYAYSQLKDSIFLAVFFTLISTVRMFLGSAEYSSISSLEVMQTNYMILLFWVIHLTAIYSTASAVLGTVGAPALKQLRVWMCKRKKKLNIIFGINDNSLAFANEIIKDEDAALIIVDENLDSLYSEAVAELGCLYFVGNEATHSKDEFIKRIGIRNNKSICVYALNRNEAKNLNYVYRLKKSLEMAAIESKNTSLTIMANMEMAFGSDLQATDDKYGFGSVLVFDRAYLTAHMLVQKYPPCNYVKFDNKTAKACDGEIFNTVIVGFGKIGQAVLKNLVINGQFEGCDFKATVFDPKIKDISGYILKNNNSMFDRYAIDLKSENAQEREFFRFIEENSSSVDYIVVCTGNEDLNSEIAGEIQSTLKRLKAHAQVFQCSYDNIIHQRHEENGEYSLEVTDLYTADNMCITSVDKRAMVLNHIYCGGKSALDDWKKARFIDRMSSRASADFSTAYLKITGFSEDDVIKSDVWKNLDDIQKENLSKTEHLRWCAFFYSLGYEPMSKLVFDQRSKQYLDEIERLGKSSIKIQKDDEKLLHACLVEWDDLDELTQMYRAVTGDTKKDYKIDDTNNVMLVPQILSAKND